MGLKQSDIIDEGNDLGEIVHDKNHLESRDKIIISQQHKPKYLKYKLQDRTIQRFMEENEDGIDEAPSSITTLSTKFFSTSQISISIAASVVAILCALYFRRKIASILNTTALSSKIRTVDNNWGKDYDYATVTAEYDELLDDNFMNEEFTQDGDGSDEESIASILSEWSGDYKNMEMTDLGSDK